MEKVTELEDRIKFLIDEVKKRCDYIKFIVNNLGKCPDCGENPAKHSTYCELNKYAEMPKIEEDSAKKTKKSPKKQNEDQEVNADWSEIMRLIEELKNTHKEFPETSKKFDIYRDICDKRY